MLFGVGAAWVVAVNAPAAAASWVPRDSDAPLQTVRRSSCDPVVDLGYAKYRGSYNATYDLNIWKSIRYAAPPVGELRWQAPQLPTPSDCGNCTIPAVEQPPICPQSGAFGTPEVYGFNSGPGDEDCLFVNVYAAPEAQDLPVLVWIHGGGYAVFGASYEPSVWMNTNDNGFITVEIQYRLGAFGYLASEEVKEKGQLNAGLLDMRFALEWVQEHIASFGGDPDRVTIAGESSGAGSVLHMSLMDGGQESNLFENIIAASPYLPAVYHYSDEIPVGNYQAFAQLAGCGSESVGTQQHGSTFDCLVAADTEALQNASGTVSTTRGYYGSFAFLPVIDGDFIQKRPSEQLQDGHVSGKRLLVGNNANEGVPLTDPTVETPDQYFDLINTIFPLFTQDDRLELDVLYDIENAHPGNDGVRFDTVGDSGPTALNQSSYATGIQQAVFNMVGETTFACPAQWFAEAFSSGDRQAWKYQYSAAASHHGADLPAYFSVGVDNPADGFRHAFQRILGSFIINDTPVITVADAKGGDPAAVVPTVSADDEWIHWPSFNSLGQQQLDLNITGGEVHFVDVTEHLSYYVRTGDDIVNHFRLADSYDWEGGRGVRCEFWRDVSPRVPQ